MNILITGASRGIGYSMVEILSQDGDNNIYAISRNIKKLKELSVTAKGNIFPIQLDINLLLDKFDINSLNLEKIDILINNAGLLINRPFEEIEVEEIQEMFKVNFYAPSIIIKKLLPLFSKNGCHVVNIGSMGGFQGSDKFNGLSYYSASKAALASLTECLAKEYSDTKHKFNCLALGAVQTEMLNQAFPGYKAPLEAVEMAQYIIEFAKNGQRYYNGKILPVSLMSP